MNVNYEYKRVHFLCDCHWAAHGLTIEQDTDGFVEIYVTNSRWDLSLWQRIKAAITLIRGGDHAMSGVILDRDSVTALASFVRSLELAPTFTMTTSH